MSDAFQDDDTDEVREAKMLKAFEDRAVALGQKDRPSTPLTVTPMELDEDGKQTGRPLPPPESIDQAPDSSDQETPEPPDTESKGGWGPPDTGETTPPVEQTEATSELPPPPPPSSTYHYAGPILGQHWEGDLNQTQMAEALSTYALVNSWTPETRQQIDGLLSGQYELVPKGSTPPPPPPATPDPSISEEDWADVDPAVKRMYEAQQAQLRQMEALVQQNQQVVAQQQAQTITQQAAAIASQVQQNYHLDDAQFAELENYAASLNLMQPMSESLGGNVLAAYQRVLDYAYNTHPTLSQTKLAPVDEKRIETLNTRKSKASALNGSSGTPSTPTKPPSTKAERQQAFSAGVAAAWQDQ